MKWFSSYFHFPTSHSTVLAVSNTSVLRLLYKYVECNPLDDKRKKEKKAWYFQKVCVYLQIEKK